MGLFVLGDSSAIENFYRSAQAVRFAGAQYVR